MIRHLLVLPDGRQISSGGPGQAIREVKRTVYCNEGSELAPGAVAATVLEMEVFAADSLGLAAGEEVALYRVSDGGERSLLGIFRLEKPTRISRNLLRLTACDRLSLLDRDVSPWLASLNGWPYKLWDFLSMVFDHCGLEWVDETIPCADLKVDAFSAAGITARQLISWGAQLAGRFCRATADGRAEFCWYTPIAFPIGPTGEAFYYQGSLSFEDYQVEKIQKIQLRQTATDVGAIYPDTDERLNTLAITGNLLLSGCDLATRQAVAQGLLEQLGDISYTPMTLAVPEQLGLGAGDMICVQSPDGQMLTAYIMESIHTGGRAELRCTGAANREASAAFNQQSYKALTGRVLELQTDMDGIRAENRDAAGNLAALRLTLEGLQARVQQQSLREDGLKQQLSQLALDAGALALRLQSVEEKGADKVTTQTGYTFDENGLHIDRSGHPVASRLDHAGLYVTRYGQPVLTANDAGVIAYDVTVGNYLVIGSHARFEDYMDALDSRRTACFFVG